MLPIKNFRITTVALLLSVSLYGCGSANYPGPPTAQPEGPEILPEPEIAAPATSTESIGLDEFQPDSEETVLAEPEKIEEIRELPFDYADIEFIQHRLIVYENKYDRWLVITESELDGAMAEEIASFAPICSRKLENIISGYHEIIERLQQHNATGIDTGANVDFKGMQQLDINFLESKCDKLIETDLAAQLEAKSPVEPGTSFSELEAAIEVQMANGDYQEVLSAYSSLVADFPERQPSLQTRLDYGRALQYTGQLNEAARHYKNMLTSDDLDIQPLSIQRTIADILLAAADVDAAELSYNTLTLQYQSVTAEKAWAQEQLAFLRSVEPESEEMLGYIELLREFQTYDYKIHGPRLNEMINQFAQEHAGSPAAVSALRLKTFAAEQLQSWFGRQLVKIDTLVAEKKFSEANELLRKISGYSLPADLEVVVQKTYFDVARAEIHARENQRLKQEMELTTQWESAVKLLDSRQYDAAISAFTDLIGTEYDEQARMKITEAADEAAGEMRKEAASLFIKAGRTTDMEHKKRLLADSYKLLSDILAKYPQTELLEKVQQNIAILEEQIERLDPTLLEELHRVNSAGMPTDSAIPGPWRFQ